MQHILVVEDEAAISKFIEINLQREGYSVDCVGSGEAAIQMEHSKLLAYEVIILDVNLPNMDGFQACMTFRSMNYEGIIIMLTARGQDMDRIMGLELGADDYMVKPFNPLELSTRIRAIQRRTGRNSQATKNKKASFGHLSVDEKARVVSVSSQEIALSPKEYDLLIFLVHHSEKALHRDELLNGVWGEDFFGDYKTVDVHIRRLREKVEIDPSKPKLIETVWGIGYRWRSDGWTYETKN